jgi:hypothetical protein
MWIEEELAGKKIIGIKVKSPTVWLQVEGGGWVEISAEGDCCSLAFIDSVVLVGSPTLTGEQIELDFPAQSTVQEVDKIYVVKFIGDTGYVALIHRNSSNGYYGNFLEVKSRGEPPEDAEDGKEWYREIVEATQ